MSILCDTMEPIEIQNLIDQSVPTIRTGLNSQGIADYTWFCCDGHRVQVERKQTGELLSSLDKVEEQLQRELSNGIEETILLIEGVCEPVFGLKLATQTWYKSNNKNVMVPGRVFNCSYNGYKAWQNQLDKAGVTIVETFDYTATAITLVALYQNGQKEDHKTLKRYIKNRIYIESKNPHIKTLMGITGANIGEEIATALIDRYGTPYYIVKEDPEELANTLIGEEGKEKRFGMLRTKKLLKAFGRNV